MPPDAAPEISSFLLRFVASTKQDGDPAWRGMIHHIQSGSEIPFTRRQDAVAFIQETVALEDMGVEDTIEG